MFMPMTSYRDLGTSSNHTVTGGNELILLNADCKGESGTLLQPKGGFISTQARPDNFHKNKGISYRFGNNGKKHNSVKSEYF